MKKSIYSLLVIVGVFLLWPSPIDPIAWNAPVDKGFTGAFKSNDLLTTARLIPITDGLGPETVILGPDGHLYGGLQDGRIIRYIEGKGFENFVTIEGGRPLGLAFDHAGTLIVADAWKGLLSIASSGEKMTLSTEAEGVPFAFADDLAITSDGIIYFSDASSKFGQSDFRLDLLEARPNGRLLKYDPITLETTVIMRDLYFANGVALSKDEDFVLVNETGRYRIKRYWLKGDKIGTSDIFIDNLPGFPDGLTSNGKGLFWLAIPSPRSADLDEAHKRPFLKSISATLPKNMQPQAIPYGAIFGLNEAGEVVANFQDTSGEAVYMVTAVTQDGNKLYIGSLDAAQMVIFDLPASH